jgi:hypothetical protein
VPSPAMPPLPPARAALTRDDEETGDEERWQMLARRARGAEY